MSDITRSEAIKTLKEHLSHWERLLREHICEEQEGIDTISALKLAIADLETDEVYQLEYEQPKFCEDCISRAEAKKGVETWSGGWIEYIKSLPSVYPKSKTFTENCIACVYDEIETETGVHCKKCLDGDSQYKSVFDFVKENLAIKALEQEPTTKNDLGVDAVSRKELLKIYNDRFSELQKLKHLKDNKGAEDRQMGVNYCINILKELPSVTPQEPRKGHWIGCKCEKCGYKVQPWNTTNYCPNCGSDNRKVVEE
jgi:hypothetical protein